MNDAAEREVQDAEVLAVQESFWREVLGGLDVQGRAFDSALWEASRPGSPLLVCGPAGAGKSTFLHLLARHLGQGAPVLLVRTDGASWAGLEQLPAFDALLGEFVQVWGEEVGVAGAGVDVLDLGRLDVDAATSLVPGSWALSLLSWANARGYRWVLADEFFSRPELLSVSGTARLVLCVHADLHGDARCALEMPEGPEALLADHHPVFFEWVSVYRHLSLLWLSRSPTQGLLIPGLVVQEPLRSGRGMGARYLSESSLDALFAGPGVRA